MTGAPREDRAARLVVLGSLNLDVILRVPRLPRPGETVVGGRSTLAGGGKGANQAVAAARLGAQTSLVGRLGRDGHGRRLRALVRQAGVDTWAVRGCDQPSGLALILVDDAGENLIGVAPGANATVDVADVERAAALIAAADLVVAQLEVPLAAVSAAAQRARQAGVPFLLNAAPVGRDIRPLLAHVDILVVNDLELAALAGVPPGGEGEAALGLLAHGPRAVVVTLGARGALVAQAGRRASVPAFPITPVDTTGAGDCFVAALAVRCARGEALDRAASYACAAAALSCTRAGAQPSLPTAEEVARFLAGRSTSPGQPRRGR